MSDSDPDGGDIFTTLICLFYEFWPELFDPKQKPFFFRLEAPNVAAVKGKKRIHFVSRAEFEANKNKVAGYSISYYKGLGSMEREDWEMVINDPRCLIPIVDDGNMKDTLKLLFSPDSEARKVWLTSNNKKEQE